MGMTDDASFLVQGSAEPVPLVGPLVCNPYWSFLKTPENLVGLCGICTMPCIPLRAQPSDGAEMEGQLLFGEPFEVLASSGRSLKVRRLFRSDQSAAWGSVSGWIDDHFVPACIVPPEDVQGVVSSSVRAIVACHTVRARPRSGTYGELTLPCGSILRGYDALDRSFLNAGERYELVGAGRVVVGAAAPHVALLLELLAEFDGVQYLLGGQTTWGVDCSGLVQTILAIFGVEVPRNAREQSSYGTAVALEDARTGDLLFLAPRSGVDAAARHVGFLVRGRCGRLALYHARQRVKCQLLPSGVSDVQDLMPPEKAHLERGLCIRRVVRFD
jgi:hypothetical protein